MKDIAAKKRTLVIATGNLHKVQEIQSVINLNEYELKTQQDFEGVPEIIEDGATIEENALKKARIIAEFTGCLSLADDTGLEVDALNGAPGVYSSRYAGPNVTYADNNRKLLKELHGVPDKNRTARFRCVMALVGGSFEQTVEGVCEGVILNKLRGSLGFGYDPLFYVTDEGKTFAEMDLERKNQISHRGIALAKMNILLQDLARGRNST